MSQPIARCAWPAPPKHGRPDLTDPCIPSRPSSHNDRHHTRPATHRSSSLTTPDRLSYLTAQDAQLHRRLAVSPVLESGDRHPHSDADSHAARTMQPIRSTALFPTIRRTGQQTRIASPPRRWHRRTTVPQTGQRTGHSARRGTVSYSEIPLSTSWTEKCPIPPFGKLEYLFRNDFDDIHALSVLNSARRCGYNYTYTNIRSRIAVFANRSENRSEKRPRIGSR